MTLLQSVQPPTSVNTRQFIDSLLTFINRNMPKENLDEVDHLLQTVIVPAFPANRSQWRKLEITMEFINKSKNSVRQTRIINANTYSLLSVPQQSNTMKTERMKKAKHIAFSCDAEIIRKENPNQSKHKQQSKWS